MAVNLINNNYNLRICLDSNMSTTNRQSKSVVKTINRQPWLRRLKVEKINPAKIKNQQKKFIRQLLGIDVLHSIMIYTQINNNLNKECI